MEDTPDVGAVVDQIKSGDYDGQRVTLIEAVRTRFENGTTAQRWKIDYQDRIFTEDDLTLAEAATVEKITGTSWGLLNPVASANECQSIIAACLHHRDGLKMVDSMKQAGELTAADAVKAISAYEVDVAPKD
mgnify:FL=1